MHLLALSLSFSLDNVNIFTAAMFADFLKEHTILTTVNNSADDIDDVDDEDVPESSSSENGNADERSTAESEPPVE